MNYFNYSGSCFQTQLQPQIPILCPSPNVFLYQMAPCTFIYPVQSTADDILNPQLYQSESTQLMKCCEPKPKQQEVTIKNSSENFNKKNMRNIIPNIAHQILRFISSDGSREIIKKRFPKLSQPEITKFYEYTSRLRKSMRFYVGNKDLLHLWFHQTKSPKQKIYYQIIRILSRFFLNTECVVSILLSRRMKSSLKEEHLHCRRKLLSLLNRGPRRA